MTGNEFIEFKNDLLSSKYFKNIIIGNHEVILIYLGGSRSFNLEIEDSDYDLVVILNDKEYLQEEFLNLNYKGSKIHWYYWSLHDYKEFLNIDAHKNYSSFHTFLGGSYEMGPIIYENEKYKNLADDFKKTNATLAPEYRKKYILLYEPNIKKILNQNLDFQFKKYVYYLCFQYYKLLNLDMDYDFLKTLKSCIKTRTVDDIIWKRVKDILYELVKYFKITL